MTTRVPRSRADQLGSLAAFTACSVSGCAMFTFPTARLCPPAGCRIRSCDSLEVIRPPRHGDCVPGDGTGRLSVIAYLHRIAAARPSRTVRSNNSNAYIGRSLEAEVDFFGQSVGNVRAVAVTWGPSLLVGSRYHVGTARASANYVQGVSVLHQAVDTFLSPWLHRRLISFQGLWRHPYSFLD